MLIPLIATASFSHRGRQMTVGQAVNATSIEALAYTYQRWAKFARKTEAAFTEPVTAAVVPRRVVRRRSLTAEPE